MRELATFNRNVRQTNEPSFFRLVHAEVIAPAPTGSAVKAKVRALDEPGGGEHFLGEASWPQPAGSAVPGTGDECLVGVDETGTPWVLGWAQSGW
jgi:hypothetical protein